MGYDASGSSFFEESTYLAATPVGHAENAPPQDQAFVKMAKQEKQNLVLQA